MMTRKSRGGGCGANPFLRRISELWYFAGLGGDINAVGVREGSPPRVGSPRIETAATLKKVKYPLAS